MAKLDIHKEKGRIYSDTFTVTGDYYLHVIFPKSGTIKFKQKPNGIAEITEYGDSTEITNVHSYSGVVQTGINKAIDVVIEFNTEPKMCYIV